MLAWVNLYFVYASSEGYDVSALFTVPELLAGEIYVFHLWLM